ncbi:MAG: bifunctional indole-3-glycerol-phosphate synthase TrpC/phosphoribosylanthranilate isomerase TrpF [Alphaproteobacteria bacterium]|nr:bifunctional indole-3-glycerol-phosphate synthase TrpC/phosphoribosylanthranilate isomerase TrpF [Alphaproteobacteria bacterium]MBV9370056.1 bifunctional indole-3-glycerol-phosphate synthase TrpC/phosphoribosylanthranilate isomerase TrpF [Alphaproteobacteria bacterium]MBV9900730.1 bifunctional indole-3-glycerol-phosphate synthase TrpC/phosphoribosylanthranilate isomerase TrpF [Alphaproteobacteria bacterium]
MAEGVLGEIVARKRVDVAERLRGIDLASLRARAEPTRRSLRAALARPGARFVMEVKRVSPSQGALRGSVDPAAMARAYRGAADAISVLTDGPYFGGSFADLEAVRREYDGPILAKDFVVDPRQVAEARLHGADAVLVILAVLGDAEAVEAIEEARRLGMDALVEAHDEAEVRRAVALGAPMIGINNRDLKTLKVDLAATERLARLVPAGTLVVSESGIADRADVARLAPHADAFLVGSSLMRAPDPGLAARALAFGRVKVCGLTDAGDAAIAAAQGASFAGMVMVPDTPRAVTVDEASPIAAAASIPLVGVFRDERPDRVAAAARRLDLAAVQLHGEEDGLYISGLRALLPEGTEIWAAGAVDRDLPEPRPGADRMLYDTKANGRSGGTGVAFDWTRLEGRPDLGTAVLAGGLSPANAAAAARVGAYALDVGSGVESAPGRKDPGKLQAFFEALRLPARGEALPC